MSKFRKIVSCYVLAYFLMLPVIVLIHTVIDHPIQEISHDLGYQEEVSHCDLCELYYHLSAISAHLEVVIVTTAVTDPGQAFIDSFSPGLELRLHLRGPPTRDALKFIALFHEPLAPDSGL